MSGTGAKTVGVLGGMGPMATVEFYRRLVVNTWAEIDQDHLHIVIDNDPTLPDRTGALLRGTESPGPGLCAMARRLEAAGAEVLAMPCNTAHAFIEEIRSSVRIPMVDMIEETATAIGRPRVGVLASNGTIETGLYQRVLKSHGIEAIVPEPKDQAVVMNVIFAIKAGRQPARLVHRIEPVVERLAEAGAKVALAACTELSLLSGESMAIEWIDALDILVRATLRAAGARSVGEREESE